MASSGRLLADLLLDVQQCQDQKVANDVVRSGGHSSQRHLSISTASEIGRTSPANGKRYVLVEHKHQVVRCSVKAEAYKYRNKINTLVHK